MKLDLVIQDRLKLIFRILLAALFLLSAVAKLYPSPNFALNTFEQKQLIPMGFNELTAAYFSRSLIGIELALGILLLQPHYYKKLILPAAFLLLFVFSAHLSYEIISTGNEGNCGCFGSLLPMSPLGALIKNVIAMGVIVWLFKVTDKTSDRLNLHWISTVTLASILSIYVAGPMTLKTTGANSQAASIVPSEDDINFIVHQKVDSILSLHAHDHGDSISKPVTVKLPEESKGPKKKNSGFANYFPDIDEGRKILCFFAPGCDHCKETVKELTQLKRQVKDFPPMRILFMDEEAELIPDFFAYAGTNYPYQILDVATFWQTIGSTKDTPGVRYQWNGNLIKEYEGINDNQFIMQEFKKIVVNSMK